MTNVAHSVPAVTGRTRNNANMPVVLQSRLTGIFQMTSPDRDSLNEAADQLLNQGDIRQAAVVCQTLCKSYPDFAPAWHKGSIVAAQVGSLDKADQYAARALELEPDNQVFKLQKIAVLAAKGERAEALQRTASLAPQIDTDAVDANAAIAVILSSLDQHEAALPFYLRLLELEPANATHCFNAAATYRYLGRVDAAEDQYNAGLRLNPEFHEAYYLRSTLRVQSDQHNYVGEIETLIKNEALTDAGRVQLGFALAKELDDLGRFAESFSVLQRSADRYRSLFRYDVNHDLRSLQKIATVFSSAYFGRKRSGHDSAAPIFVVGLPRTGTTLVERILGSHSDVHAAGELNALPSVLSELVRPLTETYAAQKPGPEEASARIDTQALGKRYCDLAKPPGRNEAHFVDKMPLNFKHCGLIATALPNAAIVELRRHPLAACYAIYKHLFNRAYPFSYKLEEIARYYLAERQLMNHWHSVLPGRIHTIEYEGLVNDLESATRDLLSHCGLAWEPSCLAFADNKQPATTASAIQVRQPLYRTSLTHWSNYIRELQPAIDVFAEAGVDIALPATH